MEQLSSDHLKFISKIDVSRETLQKLIIYHDLLIKWQQKINLISNSTLENIWKRHFLDSAQIFNLLSDPTKSIFDLGSGAGFPGMILSLMGAPKISLLESDSRKAIFLSEVIRSTGASAKVVNERIESANDLAHTIVSRACASLDKLLFYSYRLLEPKGECVFLKGKNTDQEIKEAQKNWLFHVEQIPSCVDSEGVILKISDLQPKA